MQLVARALLFNGVHPDVVEAILEKQECVIAFADFSHSVHSFHVLPFAGLN